jgi:hypothetical protein
MTIQVVVGVLFYFGAAHLLKMERFKYLVETIMPLRKKKN